MPKPRAANPINTNHPNVYFAYVDVVSEIHWNQILLNPMMLQSFNASDCREKMISENIQSLAVQFASVTFTNLFRKPKIIGRNSILIRISPLNFKLIEFHIQIS